METLSSARRRIRAPISYDFRKFFVSVWSSLWLGVHKRLPLWYLKKRRSGIVRVSSSLKWKWIGTKQEFLIWNQTSGLTSTQATTKSFWKCGLQIAVCTGWDPWALAQSGLFPKSPFNSWFWQAGCEFSIVSVTHSRSPTFLCLWKEHIAFQALSDTGLPWLNSGLKLKSLHWIKCVF